MVLDEKGVPNMVIYGKGVPNMVFDGKGVSNMVVVGVDVYESNGLPYVNDIIDEAGNGVVLIVVFNIMLMVDV